MKLEECFPKTIFVDEYIEKDGVTDGIIRQLKVVNDEIIEVHKPIIEKDFDRAMEELLDTMHATYTALRMVPGYDIKKVSDLIKQIHRKNNERGYYGVQF